MTYTRFLFLWSIIFLGPISSFAEEEKKDNPPSTTVIDKAHQQVSSTILLISNRIDSFFGSQRGDDEANGSRLRLFYDTTYQQNQRANSKADIRFTLRLPTLENFFKLDFKREGGVTPPTNEELEKAESQSTPPDPTPKQLLIQASKWTFNFNAGLRLDIPPNIFARARLRRTFTLFNAFEFNPTQEATWFREEGFGLNFTHDLDYPITNDLLFRIVNSAFWRDETDLITTSHGPTLFHQLSSRRAISYSAQAQGVGRPFFYINAYVGSINYRQLVHSNWMFFNFSPSVSFPKDNDWKEVYTLFIRLEAVFGTI